jgi:hypothetical protein
MGRRQGLRRTRRDRPHPAIPAGRAQPALQIVPFGAAWKAMQTGPGQRQNGGSVRVARDEGSLRSATRKVPPQGSRAPTRRGWRRCRMQSGWHADCPVRRASLAHGRESYLWIRERTWLWRLPVRRGLSRAGAGGRARQGRGGGSRPGAEAELLEDLLDNMGLDGAFGTNGRPLARQCAARSRSESGMPLREVSRQLRKRPACPVADYRSYGEPVIARPGPGKCRFAIAMSGNPGQPPAATR